MVLVDLKVSLELQARTYNIYKNQSQYLLDIEDELLMNFCVWVQVGVLEVVQVPMVFLG